MLDFVDTIKHFISLPREQLGRSMVLMKLCKEAKEVAHKMKENIGQLENLQKSENLEKINDLKRLEKELEDFVDMACEYIKCSAEEHKKGSGNTAATRLAEICRFLEKGRISSHIPALTALRVAEEKDKEVEKDQKRELENISKREQEGKSKKVLLLFPGDAKVTAEDDELTSVAMKVNEKTSSTGLAAMVYYYEKMRRDRPNNAVRFIHFYETFDRRPSKAPWAQGNLPEQLLAIIDRGRIEIRIPQLLNTSLSIASSYFMFRNLFKLEGIRYLKESHGIIRLHEELKGIPEMKVKRITEGREEPEERRRWSDAFDCIKAEGARDDDWVLSPVEPGETSKTYQDEDQEQPNLTKPVNPAPETQDSSAGDLSSPTITNSDTVIAMQSNPTSSSNESSFRTAEVSLPTHRLSISPVHEHPTPNNIPLNESAKPSPSSVYHSFSEDSPLRNQILPVEETLRSEQGESTQLNPTQRVVPETQPTNFKSEPGHLLSHTLINSETATELRAKLDSPLGGFPSTSTNNHPTPLTNRPEEPRESNQPEKHKKKPGLIRRFVAFCTGKGKEKK